MKDTTIIIWHGSLGLRYPGLFWTPGPLIIWEYDGGFLGSPPWQDGIHFFIGAGDLEFYPMRCEWRLIKVFPKIGGTPPKCMVYNIMVNPIWHEWFGGILIFGNIHFLFYSWSLFLYCIAAGIKVLRCGQWWGLIGKYPGPCCFLIPPYCARKFHKMLCFYKEMCILI